MNEELLSTGSYDGTVIVWETKSGDPRQTINAFELGIHSVAFDRCAQKLAVYDASRSLSLFVLGNGEFVSEKKVQKVQSKDSEAEQPNNQFHLFCAESVIDKWLKKHFQETELRA